MVRCQWKPRRLNQMLRRASTHYDKANALTNTTSGGRIRSDHGDGGGGGAPTRLCVGLELTELNQWAGAGARSRWDGGGAVAVMEKLLGAACVVNDDGGAVVLRLQLLRVL